MPTNIWYDVISLTNKAYRQSACDKLVADTLDSAQYPHLRTDILGSQDKARSEFESRYTGPEKIPPDVRFICIKPDLVSRSNLVVLCLPPIPGEMPYQPIRPIWQDTWLASWAPY